MGLLASASASAQQAPPPDTEAASRLCRVFAVDGVEGQPAELRAGCRGHGLMLGRADAFEVIASEALQATLVDVVLGSERRILMLTIRSDGQPLLEDLTGQIARTAGRGPMSKIDGVTVDLSEFGQSGEIAVRGNREDLVTARADRIDLGDQIAAERARFERDAAQDRAQEPSL